LQDLEAIAEYIAADSPTYAGIVVKKVVNETRIWRGFPVPAGKFQSSATRTFAS